MVALDRGHMLHSLGELSKLQRVHPKPVRKEPPGMGSRRTEQAARAPVLKIARRVAAQTWGSWTGDPGAQGEQVPAARAEGESQFTPLP